MIVKMKKIITIKIEVDMEHPARDEWGKRKDFIDTEIDDVLDHIRDFTRPYKKESGFHDNLILNFFREIVSRRIVITTSIKVSFHI